MYLWVLVLLYYRTYLTSVGLGSMETPKCIPLVSTWPQNYEARNDVFFSSDG
jgi:hypothetical protein